MRMPLNTIKKIMQDAINNGEKQISTKAIFLMTQKLEDFIIEKTKQAEKKLIKMNELRKIQGLPEKVRISEDLLSEVL